MTTTPSSTILELAVDADWRRLLDSLSRDDQLPSAAAANIVEQLRSAGARSALVEDDYLDRDYSEEFSAFYSRLFQRYRRRTRRFHFFRNNLSDVADQGVGGLIDAMEAAAEPGCGDYLGFLVVRPVHDAPVGRAVLGFVGQPAGAAAHVQVRATYETHPLGAKLAIYGIPFTQQDRRISACAQASIWVCGRHFHTRHAGPWFSTSAISEAASKPTDYGVSSSVPAGSSGLGVNNMLRALREMDRHPYAFAGEKTKQGDIVWPLAFEPREVLARYVGSGIPVIAGLRAWSGQGDGHAVVVVGDTFLPLASSALPTSHPTIAELSPYFLVHDDQRGPNLRMPARPGLPDAETPYNIADHLAFLIVPLPDKVFITAESAEIAAWDRLGFYRREWPGLKAEHGEAIGDSVALGEQVLEGELRNQVIARTYLTMGWKYKARLHEAGAAQVLRSQVAMHELPRMVWVTEFGLLDDLNKLDPQERRIFGHCVTDATSTGPSRAPLVVHFPGFLWLSRHLDPTFFTQSDEDLHPLVDDTLYQPRRRKLF